MHPAKQASFLSDNGPKIAFDTGNRKALWTVLEPSMECPPKFINIVKLFKNGMTDQVLCNGDVIDRNPSSSVMASDKAAT